MMGARGDGEKEKPGITPTRDRVSGVGPTLRGEAGKPSSPLPAAADEPGSAREGAAGLGQPEKLGPGDVLAGKYLLGEPLGAGGMGRVFKGEHLLLHVPIAVKVLHDFALRDPKHIRRFQREARAAVVLSHPNAVRVFDFGSHAGAPFIVMEYIEGIPLDEWLLEQTPLPSLEQIASIMTQVLAALDSAHGLGIVHRDLKPENVLLSTSKEGKLTAKIVDFGLAHVDDPADDGPTLTNQDAVAGTPSYMSPEQCRSLSVGPSTDLYAAGCLLTTLLQGDPPFSGATPMDTIAKQMFLPPPALDRPDEAEPVPPLLERLRKDLLAKQPHARPPDAATTADRLREALSPQAHAKRLPSRKGDIPLGNREERAPSWTHGSVPPHGMGGQAPTTVSANVLSLGPHEDGWDEGHEAGLAAQGVVIRSVAAEPGAQLPPADVTIIDAGLDTQKAVEALKALRNGPTVVCIARAAVESMNRLIEAGASEVVRYPIAADKLARRVRRAAKRGR